jgi:hypothetical protein
MATKSGTNTKKSPLGRTEADHESKEKLVDKLVGLLGNITTSDENKDDIKARLLAASNKKLLRLFEVGNEIKSKFGSVDKAAEALAKTLGRQKDADYIKKLKTYAPARLLDLYRAAEKRVTRTKKAA